MLQTCLQVKVRKNLLYIQILNQSSLDVHSFVLELNDNELPPHFTTECKNADYSETDILKLVTVKKRTNFFIWNRGEDLQEEVLVIPGTTGDCGDDAGLGIGAEEKGSSGGPLKADVI